MLEERRNAAKSLRRSLRFVSGVEHLHAQNARTVHFDNLDQGILPRLTRNCATPPPGRPPTVVIGTHPSAKNFLLPRVRRKAKQCRNLNRAVRVLRATIWPPSKCRHLR